MRQPQNDLKGFSFFKETRREEFQDQARDAFILHTSRLIPIELFTVSKT